MNGGALPSALEGLAPGFIDRVPVDPFSGSPLKLRRSAGSYVIYSVGANFKDDGGTMLKAPRTPGTFTRERPELAPDFESRSRSNREPEHLAGFRLEAEGCGCRAKFARFTHRSG